MPGRRHGTGPEEPRATRPEGAASPRTRKPADRGTSTSGYDQSSHQHEGSSVQQEVAARLAFARRDAQARAAAARIEAAQKVAAGVEEALRAVREASAYAQSVADRAKYEVNETSEAAGGEMVSAPYHATDPFICLVRLPNRCSASASQQYIVSYAVKAAERGTLCIRGVRPRGQDGSEGSAGGGHSSSKGKHGEGGAGCSTQYVALVALHCECLARRRCRNEWRNPTSLQKCSHQIMERPGHVEHCSQDACSFQSHLRSLCNRILPYCVISQTNPYLS